MLSKDAMELARNIGVGVLQRSTNARGGTRQGMDGIAELRRRRARKRNRTIDADDGALEDVSLCSVRPSTCKKEMSLGARRWLHLCGYVQRQTQSTSRIVEDHLRRCARAARSTRRSKLQRGSNTSEQAEVPRPSRKWPTFAQ